MKYNIFFYFYFCVALPSPKKAQQIFLILKFYLESCC